MQLLKLTLVTLCLQNNLRLEGTFLSVDQQGADGTWTTVRSDSHPSTTYQWVRNDTVRILSLALALPTSTPPLSQAFRY